MIFLNRVKILGCPSSHVSLRNKGGEFFYHFLPELFHEKKGTDSFSTRPHIYGLSSFLGRQLQSKTGCQKMKYLVVYCLKVWPRRCCSSLEQAFIGFHALNGSYSGNKKRGLFPYLVCHRFYCEGGTLVIRSLQNYIRTQHSNL